MTFFFIKQKTSYEMLIRYWSSDVCSSDLSAAAKADVERIEELWTTARDRFGAGGPYLFGAFGAADIMFAPVVTRFVTYSIRVSQPVADYMTAMLQHPFMEEWVEAARSEEHTSELQSLMRIS